jgi:hypothetical protein
MAEYVAYYRVSEKQGIKGLGMDAQREAVSRFMAGKGEKDTKPAPRSHAALAECRKRRAVSSTSKARSRSVLRGSAFYAQFGSSPEKAGPFEGEAKRVNFEIVTANYISFKIRTEGIARYGLDHSNPG